MIELEQKILKSYQYLVWTTAQISSLDKLIQKEPLVDKKERYANTLIGWLKHHDNHCTETIKDIQRYFKESKIVKLEIKKIYGKLTKV